MIGMLCGQHLFGRVVHRILFRSPSFSINITFVFQVISEEHDTKKLDADYIADANKNLPDVALMPNEIVPKKNLTVWIDPLDATQEYTGKIVFVSWSTVVSRLEITVPHCCKEKRQNNLSTSCRGPAGIRDCDGVRSGQWRANNWRHSQALFRRRRSNMSVFIQKGVACAAGSVVDACSFRQSCPVNDASPFACGTVFRLGMG